MSSVKDNWGRSALLADWHEGGGIMIMGYEMFRNLSQSCRIKNKKQKKTFVETLLDPGMLIQEQWLLNELILMTRRRH